MSACSKDRSGRPGKGDFKVFKDKAYPTRSFLRCPEDLHSTTRYVTWALHNKVSLSIRRLWFVNLSSSNTGFVYGRNIPNSLSSALTRASSQDWPPSSWRLSLKHLPCALHSLYSSLNLTIDSAHPFLRASYLFLSPRTGTACGCSSTT
jgi:hypothetical protein